MHSVKRALIGIIATLSVLAAPGRAADPQHARIADVGRRLVAAYPDMLARVDGNDLVWTDGTRMPLDDGKGEKDFEKRLSVPDLEDQFYAPYPVGAAGLPPAFQSDPGRVRYEPFFRKMYGDCRAGEVVPRLVEVVWLPTRWGHKIKVTEVNGVARRLTKVSEELDRLHVGFLDHLRPTAGTYSCRPIAGTDRMSMHGYGAAIDISLKYAHYWLWTTPESGGRYPYQNEIPMEIVRIFEAHGFIWGGKWYHYDTMHFEYRPELLPAGEPRP